MKVHVVISTGVGRLIFTDAVPSIAKHVEQVSIICGWIPPKSFKAEVMDAFGEKVLGRRSFGHGLLRRRAFVIPGVRTFPLVMPEVVAALRGILVRLGLIKVAHGATLSWKIHGWLSKRKLKSADVFHVRGGAGGGGAIERARELGAVVLGERSLPHPTELRKQMRLARGGEGGSLMDFDNSNLWDLISQENNMCDHFVVNSDYVKDSMVANGFDSSRVHVVRRGVREDFQGIKKSYKREGILNLLFVGDFCVRKGARQLVSMATVLASDDINFKIDVVGRESLRTEILELDIAASHFRFHGHVPQLRLKNYLIAADIFIFPSYCEGSAQAVNEAMAAGLPVIATSQTGSLIVHDKNGLLVDAGDERSLARFVKDLAGDENRRRRLGLAAAETIKNEMTWDLYGAKMAMLYDRLVREKADRCES